MQDTRIISVPRSKYLQFYNCDRTFAQMQKLLLRLAPSLGQKSKTKRQQIVNGFQEVKLEPGTLLECEDKPPKYLWLILQGEVEIYKRPESLYDHEGQMTDSSGVNLWSNPNDSGNKMYGCKVGIIKDSNFICEDAIFFNQCLVYSVKTKTQVLAWRLQS